jgi:hypothetical protein
MTYRNKSPDVATEEDLREEVKRLRAENVRLSNPRGWRKWWSEMEYAREPMVVIVAVLVVACAFAWGIKSSHDADVSCSPERVYRQNPFGSVICTDGEKRWVVER